MPAERWKGRFDLVLDRELVVSVECPRCSWRGEVMRPRVKVKAAEAICPKCLKPAGPSSSARSTKIRPWLAEPLSRVGIPPYDIVRVDGAAESGFFLLAADRGDGKTGWGSGR